MLVLGFDTSTPAVSVALHDGGRIISTAFAVDAQASSIPGSADLAVAGAGGQLYPEAFGEVIGPAYPDAGVLCGIVARASAAPSPGQPPLLGRPRSLGQPPSPGQPPLLAVEPMYLRRPDAREPGPPKQVTP